MNNTVKRQIAEKLLEEFDYVIQHYYRQKLEDMICELRLRNMLTTTSTDPIPVLSGLRRSGVLYQSSESSLLRLRRAIDHFVNGSYGCCLHCGTELPAEWLLRCPLLEYCYMCSIRLQPTTGGMEYNTTTVNLA